MVDFFLLLQGRAGKKECFEETISTVSLSAETGKNENGLQLNPKKQKPAAVPAEPFDNTYKNLQHRDYSTYNFLYLNLDSSSSGWLSSLQD
ncbi:hypothetical protein K5549_010900 [Capra hircus]|uniref:NADH dehydrogenase [ubiquinone] flavoprotein 3, mitochondrial n=1 Tax=Capra hircus TaxID=9925 RepID=A0A452DXV5_CAPHI|nr:hypothetical protein K5549_010900 [Capra hircus]